MEFPSGHVKWAVYVQLWRSEKSTVAEDRLREEVLKDGTSVDGLMLSHQAR